MKKRNLYLGIMFLTLSYYSCRANEYSKNIIYDFKQSTWKFNIGDDSQWSKKDFSDNDWETITIGKSWEEQGYVGYDGFAWYRKKFLMPEYDYKKSLMLYIENIDDVDEIYFNGVLIGSTGKMPENYITGYGWVRKYYIPEELIKKNDYNYISVRVYDDGGEGGIVGSKMFLYVNDYEKFLKINLSGDWKIHFTEVKDWKSTDYNDNHWKSIKVPMIWESQGYFDYNGYACYRKTFYITNNIDLSSEVYLLLGKVDDYDKVYINGECIGELSPYRNLGEFSRIRGEYNTFRAYKIPKNLLLHGKNVICVKVYDETLQGGIYEGPVGITDKQSFKEFKDRYSNKSFFESENNVDNEFFEVLNNIADGFSKIIDEIFNDN